MSWLLRFDNFNRVIVWSVFQTRQEDPFHQNVFFSSKKKKRFCFNFSLGFSELIFCLKKGRGAGKGGSPARSGPSKLKQAGWGADGWGFERWAEGGRAQHVALFSLLSHKRFALFRFLVVFPWNCWWCLKHRGVFTEGRLEFSCPSWALVKKKPK